MLLRKPSHYSQLAVAIYVLLLSGCASTGGYITGQVLDADTREPIPDAHVFITWKGGAFALVDTRTVCVYADGTLTGEDGKYRFLPWIRPDRFPVGTVSPRIYVYKPGYKEIRKNRREKGDRDYFLKKYSGTREEYMDYLVWVSERARCSNDDKNLLLVNRAIYQEAREIAETPEDNDYIESFLYDLEIIEFGYDEARRRQDERWKIRRGDVNTNIKQSPNSDAVGAVPIEAIDIESIELTGDNYRQKNQ